MGFDLALSWSLDRHLYQLGCFKPRLSSPVQHDPSNRLTAFRHDRLPADREERLDDVPVAYKLREQPLTGARHAHIAYGFAARLRQWQ
jgi:hypothetical protein